MSPCCREASVKTNAGIVGRSVHILYDIIFIGNLRISRNHTNGELIIYVCYYEAIKVSTYTLQYGMN